MDALGAAIAIIAAVGAVLSGVGAMAAWRRARMKGADEGPRRSVWRRLPTLAIPLSVGAVLPYLALWMLLVLFDAPPNSLWGRVFIVFAGFWACATVFTEFDGPSASIEVRVLLVLVMLGYLGVLASHAGWFSFSATGTGLWGYFAGFLAEHWRIR